MTYALNGGRAVCYNNWVFMCIIERIGGYRVLRRLGAGGMGEVYEAEGGDGTHVALKLFAAEGAKADFFRRRFLAEARLLSRLTHPRLVKVRDFGVDDETQRPYLAMNLVLGADGRAKTLAEVMPNEADEALLALWFRDLASVIDYIHAEGVVHRDIKLNNVLVDSAGHAVLADFGISRVCDERLRQEIDVTKTMLTGTTAERQVLGTRGYMAPEILRGEEATAASDAYALAASFFRLLTGVWYDPNLCAGGAREPGRLVLGLADMLDSFEYNWTDVLGAMLA
ncbi:MAG: serine/threonine protein kinase, partial [Kiritimatiellae bacterium]|nr:serine/threonine protein kinase [Kiritimatiellia bacterium]